MSADLQKSEENFNQKGEPFGEVEEAKNSEEAENSEEADEDENSEEADEDEKSEEADEDEKSEEAEKSLEKKAEEESPEQKCQDKEDDFKRSHLSMYIGDDEYSYEDIFTPFIGGSHQDPGFLLGLKFCNNIKEIISYHFVDGDGGDDDYQLIAVWSDETYIYVKAWCDYTGFSCRGGMKLYADNSLSVLSTFAMDGKGRELLARSSWLKRKVETEAEIYKTLDLILIKDINLVILGYLYGVQA